MPNEPQKSGNPATTCPLRICFVAPNGYPVLAADRFIDVAGGAELQQALIAKELAKRGHEVSMVSMDFGQPDGTIIDRVRVHKTHQPDEGIPIVRFIHPRLTSTWAALGMARADIYYQRAAGALTGVVAHFARAHSKRFVYAAAHDLNFDPALPQIPLARDRFLYRYGLRQASAVVVQTERQRLLCRAAYGRDSTLIRSCYPPRPASARHDGPIVWVGTTKPIKRPELFIELAEHFPQHRFVLVGGAQRGTQRFETLQERARFAGNVELTGTVPYAEVEKYFDGASLLVSTSEGEGFPSTLLQAWSRGIPTVSYFQDQAVIDGQPVSTIVSDGNSLVNAVRALTTDQSLWHQKSAHAKRYFDGNHTVSSVVDRYEHMLTDLMIGKPARITG